MLNLIAFRISDYTLEIPQDPLAIIVWLIWLALIVFSTVRYRDRDFKFGRKTLLWLATLSLSVLILTPFLDIPVNINAIGADSHQIVLFAAVPWLVAGGMVGMVPAVLLAGVSGLLTAYLHSYDIFTPLIFMTSALVFSLCIQQRYRTLVFQLLRFPLFAAFISAVISIPFYFISIFLRETGELKIRMVSVINELPGAILAFGGTVLIGGGICIIFKLALRKGWGGKQQPMKPGPGEISLRFRLMAIMAPILLSLSIGLMVSSWVLAENNARRIAIRQLTTTANATSESLSVFIETGQNLLSRFAEDDRLVEKGPETVSRLLSQKADFFLFFDQLAVLNQDGELIAVYPSDTAIALPEESMVVFSSQASLEDSLLFAYPNPTENGNGGFSAIFITGMSDSSNTYKRLLWGRTAFDENIYIAPVFEALNSFEELDGKAQIIGNDGVSLYQSDTQFGVSAYMGTSYPTATFFEGQTAEGQSILQYYQPVGDTGWTVVTSLLSQAVQETAWQSAYPFLLLGIGGMFIIFLVMVFILSPVDKNIKQLEAEIAKVAAGEFESVGITGRSTGVMGSLRETFHRMIVSLQKHQKQHTDLLTLSEGITDQLTLKDSLQLIMVAALEHGVSSARIIIMDGSASDTSFPLHYRAGLGEHTRLVAPLDEDVLSLTKSRGMLVLQDNQIGKLVTIRKGIPYPAALIAIPLEWKDSLLGVFWVTYHNQQVPITDEVEYLKSLSNKASFAIINARSVGESLETTNQLEQVLNVLDDPVLILDNFGRVIFLNKAAQTLVQTQEGKYVGRMISSVFHDENLLSLLQDAEQETQSREIKISDGKTYQVVASPTQIEDQLIGVVARFKDVTQYKAQDALKTEFVITASHELRSPLTLIHGYAKLLRLTGNLNEQQVGYVRTIVDRIDEMRSLVQNLLDMGRLESGDSMEITKITAGEIVDKAVDGLTAQANQKNINLEVSIPGNPNEIEADVAFLTLAVRNLVDNAIKYTKMGGNVALSIDAQQENVVFKVQDNGIGIAPLDQRHIFEMFHRVSMQGEEDNQGAGLGLAIVKSVAERHGGKVWVESKLGKGSSFYMQIPKKQS